MAPRKLRDLIRLIRACKTAAEERETVQKECADIRASFRSEDKDYRARNVAKLLYIYMLGYPAHFGQIECMNLVSSTRFSDKRIGHLGTMLLLDEGKELHMMVTNSLKQDLNHKVPYVASLALCTLGAIASRDMARDLALEVEKLVRSTNAYIKKKATLCAVRLIRKDASLVEHFIPATRALMTEHHHGVLYTGVTMIEEMCVQSDESLHHFRRLVPTLVRLLKNLMSSGFSEDHDVAGLKDPFLQVRIIRLLRVLGKGDMEASEAMNDILAEVATNTNTSSNVGNAVLYEAVRCVMEIKAESGLRVLAINNLGKFLMNNDRNIRYVALTALLRVVQAGETGTDAVQRHRGIILECLAEPDVTIRRRALALTFALINKSNVASVVSELLDFLEVAEREFKGYMVNELLKAADKFSPSDQWHVETLLSILIKAGRHVQDEGVAEITQIIAEKTQLHTFSVQRLYAALPHAKDSQSLIQVACWCLGEFADDLMAAAAFSSEDSTVTPSPGHVLDLLQGVLQHPTHSLVSKEYAINALMKLSARIPSETARIAQMLEPYSRNHDEELQQRAAEYMSIFRSFDNMRGALLERMPVAQSKQREALTDGPTLQHVPAPAAASGGNDLLDLMMDAPSQPATGSGFAPSGGGDIMDLLGGLDMGSSSPAAPSTSYNGGGGGDLFDLMGGGPPPSSAPTGGGDLLGDLLGDFGGPIPQQQSAPQQQSMGGLDDLLGGLSSPSQPTPPAAVDPLAALMGSSQPSQPQAQAQGGVSFVAYQDEAVVIKFSPRRNADQTIDVMMETTTQLPSAVSNFTIEAAVPKSFQIQLASASGKDVPPLNTGTVTQSARVVTNAPGAALKMLLRISYTASGQQVVKQSPPVDFPQF